ncbi:hypothetical protein, partial [Janthinobacterium sp. GW460W]|uniref:hypothetical protein n=1 Tax=Janthinobacterium sp. GW460W TaxID=1981502 RepID=UPI00111BE6BD
MFSIRAVLAGCVAALCVLPQAAAAADLFCRWRHAAVATGVFMFSIRAVLAGCVAALCVLPQAAAAADL